MFGHNGKNLDHRHTHYNPNNEKKARHGSFVLEVGRISDRQIKE